MKILIVYGTTEGQTRKVADFIADRMRKQGCDATAYDASDLPGNLAINSCNAVIVAGSLHQGHYQSPLVHFVKANAAVLDRKPNAFVSVSLAAADEDGRAEAQACADEFFEKTGWRPKRTEHVAGALLYTQYDFFKRWIMKTIVRKEGGPTDASKDYEFTDWKALEKFADAFVAQLS